MTESMTEPRFTYVEPHDPLLRRLAVRLVERATGLPRIERLYRAHRAKGWSGESFFWSSLRALDLDLRYDADRLAALPAAGPLVVVSNHPFGVLDGIFACAVMERARPDFLVLTNSVLLKAPEMRDRLLPVDFSETPAALRTNLETRARALAHVRGGGCVIVFPAGAVSTSPDRLGRRAAVDGPWSPFAAQLVLKAEAAAAPIYFPGQNSRLFQIASHIHPTLRLALFFHEVRRRIGGSLELRVGAPIPFAEMASDSRAQLTQRLRNSVYALGETPQTEGARQPLPR